MTRWSDAAARAGRDWLKAIGEPVNYQPAAAAAFDLAHGGIFTAEFATILNTPQGEVETVSPALGVLLADFPSGQPPARGDKLTLTDSARTYRVRSVQNDTEGVNATLLLYED